MRLEKLCDALDEYFNVSAFDEKDWQDLISEAERGAFLRFLRPEYVNGSWNGLMLNNTPADDDIERVYLLVYPNQEVLDTIIAREVERGAPGAMIFSYQPIAYHEDDADYKVIATEQLEELQEHNISLYVCHAPLDCHPETNTAGAIADALGLEDQARFGEHYGGLGCVQGRIGATTFENLTTRIAEISELPYLRYDQIRHNGKPIQQVAIAPGGVNTAFMDEAARRGADTFITGHWWLYGSSGFATNSRERMREYVAKNGMNLVGTSRYSNALIVMRDYVPDVFRPHNIETILIRQENHWQ
jgi:putative NIF3 family GTP cyclohydrolase 1 type 2